jgi:hypothetical protein
MVEAICFAAAAIGSGVFGGKIIDHIIMLEKDGQKIKEEENKFALNVVPMEYLGATPASADNFLVSVPQASDEGSIIDIRREETEFTTHFVTEPTQTLQTTIDSFGGISLDIIHGTKTTPYTKSKQVWSDSPVLSLLIAPLTVRDNFIPSSTFALKNFHRRQFVMDNPITMDGKTMSRYLRNLHAHGHGHGHGLKKDTLYLMDRYSFGKSRLIYSCRHFGPGTRPVYNDFGVDPGEIAKRAFSSKINQNETEKILSAIGVGMCGAVAALCIGGVVNSISR